MNNEEAENSIEFYRDHYSRVIPGPGTKQFDVTHADTNEHSAALPAAFPADTRELYIKAVRIAGTGVFHARALAGADNSPWTITTPGSGIWVRQSDGLFYYQLSVANDDWDIYVIGYVRGPP